MTWRAETGVTKYDMPTVSLYDGDTLVMKAYPSPDGRQIRFVLPEFKKLENHIGTYYRYENDVPRRKK